MSEMIKKRETLTFRAKQIPSEKDFKIFAIKNVTPMLEGGIYPVKRVEGDMFEVSATVLCQGRVDVWVKFRQKKNGGDWRRIPMESIGRYRYKGVFPLEKIGCYQYTVEACPREGGPLLSYDRILEVVVDPPRALFASWYEMFHRSQGKVPGRSATFDDMIERLDEIVSMGFDTVYLPPIHPIGKTNRKGKNNALTAEEGDPGSPYAIGSEEGGHKAVHPDLGTLNDFRRFIKSAAEKGLDVALDIALNCSPDHPYVREHPQWFHREPDGTILFAENPPKKYEDIYPLNFYTEDLEDMWEEMKSIFIFWIKEGVRTFRVDNPHTKPVEFWEWVIEEIKNEYPDVIFLSEAFTYPEMMELLSMVGFTQSYTYFTWRNYKQEIIDYFTHLTQGKPREYFRGNLFTNTPDILPRILQVGGKPAFKMRVTLAATLSSLYGIYNTFELCENRAIAGKEEYLNSEKYEYKVWDWNRAGNIKNYISLLNRIRKENPALQKYDNLHFHDTLDDNILCYSKCTQDWKNRIIVVINLDPFHIHESVVRINPNLIGISAGKEFNVRDLITGAIWRWKGGENFVRLDPFFEPAHILKIED